VAHSTQKRCTRCAFVKPLSEFVKRTDRPSHQSSCKSCVSEYQAGRYLRKREAINESSRKWYAENRDRALTNSDRYRRSHLAERAERNQRRRALERSTAGVSQAAIRARVEYFAGKCWMCRGDADTVDHVKPLAAGGPHIASNMRPACRACNSGKRARWYGVGSLHLFIRD
jgi:5-methylcytosine-specific restriction endonuclease McrA